MEEIPYTIIALVYAPFNWIILGGADNWSPWPIIIGAVVFVFGTTGVFLLIVRHERRAELRRAAERQRRAAEHAAQLHNEAMRRSL